MWSQVNGTHTHTHIHTHRFPKPLMVSTGNAVRNNAPFQIFWAIVCCFSASRKGEGGGGVPNACSCFFRWLFWVFPWLKLTWVVLCRWWKRRCGYCSRPFCRGLPRTTIDGPWMQSTETSVLAPESGEHACQRNGCDGLDQCLIFRDAVQNPVVLCICKLVHLQIELCLDDKQSWSWCRAHTRWGSREKSRPVFTRVHALRIHAGA